MTSTSTSSAAAGTNPLVRLLLSEYLVLLLCGVYFLVVMPFTPGFATAGNLANVLSLMLPLLVVAMGQTFVLISGGIDLSVTSTIALASVTGAFVMTGDGGFLSGSALAVPLGIGVMLLTGLTVGVVNGAAVTQLRMPPFIVTLTTMMFFSGLAVWLTKSTTISMLPDAFNAIGGKTWRQFPIVALPLVALLAVIAHVALSRSLFGRWLYATGHNARTALISGVPVPRVTLMVYAISGLAAAISSILITSKLETGSPVHGERILLDIIGATVIGGTSLYGGKGKVGWTVFGVLFLALIENSLNLLNRSHFTIMMVKGGVILLAAVLDTLRNKLAQT